MYFFESSAANDYNSALFVKMRMSIILALLIKSSALLDFC